MTPILPWIAHLYTATGAVIALLATGMTFAHNFRAVFIYFVVATFIDSTDGVLARALKVKERLPDFDGAKLDDIIDYLMYVFIPALVVWQADLVPAAFPICAAMVLSSAYGFAQAKPRSSRPITSSPASRRTGTSSSSISTCCSSRSAPTRSSSRCSRCSSSCRFDTSIRRERWRCKWPTLVLGTMWAVVFTWMIWRLPAVDGPWTMISLVFPVYYFALSLWLQFRR